MYCNRCGAENQDQSRFCRNCGNNLDVSPVQPKAYAPAPVSAPNPAGTMKYVTCPSCGTENKASTLICVECGANISKAPESKRSEAMRLGHVQQVCRTCLPLFLIAAALYLLAALMPLLDKGSSSISLAVEPAKNEIITYLLAAVSSMEGFFMNFKFLRDIFSDPDTLVFVLNLPKVIMAVCLCVVCYSLYKNDLSQSMTTISLDVIKGVLYITTGLQSIYYLTELLDIISLYSKYDLNMLPGKVLFVYILFIASKIAYCVCFAKLLNGISSMVSCYDPDLRPVHMAVPVYCFAVGGLQLAYSHSETVLILSGLSLCVFGGAALVYNMTSGKN